MVTTIAGTPRASGAIDDTGMAARFAGPAGIVWQQGMLYVSDSQNNTIRRIDASTGAVSTIAGSPGKAGDADGVGPVARFRTPIGMTADASNNLFVADAENQLIRSVSLLTHGVRTIAGQAAKAGSSDGPAATARFHTPVAVAIDKRGNLYISDLDNHQIRHIELSTGMVRTLERVLPAGMNSPGGLVIRGSNELLVTDSYALADRACRGAFCVTGGITR
jgi:DNA-binding beta-propeller fold protein YncE